MSFYTDSGELSSFTPGHAEMPGMELYITSGMSSLIIARRVEIACGGCTNSGGSSFVQSRPQRNSGAVI